MTIPISTFSSFEEAKRHLKFKGCKIQVEGDKVNFGCAVPQISRCPLEHLFHLGYDCFKKRCRLNRKKVR